MSSTPGATAVVARQAQPVVHDGLVIHRRDRRCGTTLTLVGELDVATVPQLDLAVAQCLRTGRHTIDLDLAGLTFCDCTGLGALLDATWMTAAAAGRLRLENLCPMLVRLLTLTGTGRLITTAADDNVSGLLLPGTGMLG
ncbi:STAS domain-containing protein [Streptomyces sp. NPDC006978]|uniref:STAS domain-containing protein n=1 Tax=unclassified Streptomyces TaxID=2593676 RepID=UPI002AFFEDCE|nr:STAS domain-containing protein [Streptomyces sp. S584]